MNAAIEAYGLGKRFGRTWALRDCSLHLPAGRVIALVGPNGAGKTTFLRLACGLDDPTSGRIEVLGWQPYEQAGQILPHVGFLAQDRPLYKRLTVADLLELGKRMNPEWDMAGAQSRLAELAIPLDRPSGQLSGGQQAQVALSMVIAKRPDLLLLDEPVSGLDPLARREFLQHLMEAVAEGGLSVVLSSHIVTELERTCDYLVILADGQVHVAGEIETLLDKHQLLIGPPIDADLEHDPTVIRFSRTERQTTLMVRIDGHPFGSEWEIHPVTLEDLVLAYLARPGAREMPPPVMAFAEGDQM